MVSKPPGRRWRLLPRLGLLALLGFVGLLAAAPLMGLSGEVRDAQTGTPLAGALARAGNVMARTEPTGVFRLAPIPPWQTISFEAEGYESRTSLSWPPGAANVTLLPQTVEARLVSDETGQLVSAGLEADFGHVESIEPGRFRIAPIRLGSRLTARAEGFESSSTEYLGGAALELRLTPLRFGRVVDASNSGPVAGALILSDERFYSSDADGRFG